MRSATTDHHPSRVPLASVRSGPDDWHVVHVSVVDLLDVHWDRNTPPPGHRAPEPTLYGFTSCDAVFGDELPHAPGTHTRSMSSKATPCRVSASMAPSTSFRVTDSLKRLATTAIRRPRPTGEPANSGIQCASRCPSFDCLASR